MSEDPMMYGLLAVPPGGEAPTEPPFAPIRPEEKDQFESLRAAFSDQVETARVALMRVHHDGRDRAVIATVIDLGDEYVVTPVAMLLDGALFDQIQPPGEPDRVDPVQKDDVLPPSSLHDLLTLVEAEFEPTVPEVEEIAAWSPEIQREVQDWAAAVHFAASDNDDVVIPPLPEVLRNS